MVYNRSVLLLFINVCALNYVGTKQGSICSNVQIYVLRQNVMFCDDLYYSIMVCDKKKLKKKKQYVNWFESLFVDLPPSGTLKS